MGAAGPALAASLAAMPPPIRRFETCLNACGREANSRPPRVVGNKDGELANAGEVGPAAAVSQLPPIAVSAIPRTRM